MGKTWYHINKVNDVAEVMIYDEIGMWGITAKDFVRDLNALDAKEITVRINSIGGSIIEGFAIYDAIKTHSAEVKVRVDGGAASIASVIAMAGKTVTMAENAFMIIHNAYTGGISGDAKKLRKEAEILDNLNNKIIDIYAAKTGKPTSDIKAKMDDTTWFDAADCKAFGLCDRIDGDDIDEPLDAFKRAAAHYSMPSNMTITKIAAKFVAGNSLKKELTMAVKPVIRDGKTFVTIDGKEHEIEGALNAAVSPSAPAPQPMASAAVDVEKIRREAIEEERAYRAEFNAAMTAGGITGEAATKFEADFYKLDIKQVKWLAAQNIAPTARSRWAKAVAAPTERRSRTEGRARMSRKTATARFAESG
jgi:ATP-dependent Clp endopeptidase proteolytic subunit ClpP